MKKTRCRFRYFKEHPHHDTIWDICRGPDGRIYIGLCAEHVVDVAILYVYDPVKDTLEPVSDMGLYTGEPLTPGKIPQSKIHFSMCPAPDGKIYFATHQTTRPLGEKNWDPWGTIGDPYHGYTGGFLLVYDIATRKTEQRGVIAPYEGVRSMVLDEGRMILYGVTYPKVHLFSYDLKTGRRCDIGRLGNHGSFDIVALEDGRVLATDDWGHILIYDPESEELTATGAQLPGLNGRQCHYNFFIYPQVGPDGLVYGNVYLRGILFRYDVRTNTVTDLGPGLENPDYSHWCNALNPIVIDHDMNMYYGFGDMIGYPHLVKFDMKTGSKTSLGPVVDPKGRKSLVVGSGVTSADRRTMYFGDTAEGNVARLAIMEV